MVITPDAVDGLSPQPARDPLDGDRGLSGMASLNVFRAAERQDPMYNEMPGASEEWKTIARSGTAVNLSREYGRLCLSQSEPQHG